MNKFNFSPFSGLPVELKEQVVRSAKLTEEDLKKSIFTKKAVWWFLMVLAIAGLFHALQNNDGVKDFSFISMFLPFTFMFLMTQSIIKLLECAIDYHALHGEECVKALELVETSLLVRAYRDLVIERGRVLREFDFKLMRELANEKEREREREACQKLHGLT